MAVTIVENFQSPGRGPAGLAWDGQTLWNSDYRDGVIYGLEPQTRHVRRTLLCHGNLNGLTWDGRSLWQSLYDEAMIRRIDPVTNDFDQHIMLPDYGWLSGVAWDGQSLWVVAQQQGQLMSLDEENGAIRSRLSVPIVCGDIDFHEGALWASIAAPMNFDYSSGRFSAIADSLEFAIIAIDPVTGAEMARYAADQFFTGLCWVDDDLWLAQSTTGTLLRSRLT